MRAVIDTNILIDYLAGVEAARDELARHADASISADHLDGGAGRRSR